MPAEINTEGDAAAHSLFSGNHGYIRNMRHSLSKGNSCCISYGAFPLHGTARYSTVHFWGVFHSGTVPGTFLVPPRPGFQVIRTVTKT